GGGGVGGGVGGGGARVWVAPGPPGGAGLGGQEVGPAVGAQRAALSTVDRDAEPVRVRLLSRRRIGRSQLVLDRYELRRVRAEHDADVCGQCLELHIRDGVRAEIAARAGERHPWRRRRHAFFIDHDRLAVGRVGRGPVDERGVVPARVIVTVEYAIRICHRDAVPVRIDAGQRGDDVVCGMRDQRGEMIAAHRAVLQHEIEQVRHLLEIGWDVWIVATQVHVVELDLHDLLAPVAEISLGVSRNGPGAQHAGSNKQGARQGGGRAQPLHGFLPVDANDDWELGTDARWTDAARLRLAIFAGVERAYGNSIYFREAAPCGCRQG